MKDLFVYGIKLVLGIDLDHSPYKITFHFIPFKIMVSSQQLSHSKCMTNQL